MRNSGVPEARFLLYSQPAQPGFVALRADGSMSFVGSFRPADEQEPNKATTFLVGAHPNVLKQRVVW